LLCSYNRAVQALGETPMGRAVVARVIAAGVILAGLAACDGGGSALPARSHEAALESGGQDARTQSASYGGRESSRDDRAAASTRSETVTPEFKGRPMWADNRRHSAEENVQYQFEHHGKELGAANLEAFLTKAHAFVSDPPKTALTTTRANGDTLMYDPASGLFAVARKDGAPRTVFKPDDGMAYWQAQQGQANSASSRARRDTGAGGTDS
jgi:pyocin large subunit-like protein